LGEYVGQFIGDYAVQVGVTLVVLTATAVWIISRRPRYVKSADYARGIEVLRLEFRRSIDEARAATTKKATAVGDKLLSVMKPIDRNVTDLNVRFARLEERADAVEAFMAGPQKDVLRENEQIDARLRKLEQRLTTLTDQVSLIEQTIDGASQRDQERNNSIEVRLTSTEKQMDDLFPRLELGEKARADLGSLISLFVKQLKRVNIISSETAVRVVKLESLRSKIAGLEERLNSTLDHESHRPAENFTTNDHADIGHASPNPGDEARVIETNVIETNNGSASGKPTEEPPNEPTLDVLSLSENSSATGANGHV
jgi:predicted  nucleic acid-binding Zn-ribbon protein